MSKRIDPPSRPVDGAITDMALIGNKRPDRVYAVANPNCQFTGVDEYVRQGWEIEIARKDGIKILGGKPAADGSAVTLFGQIVMSRSVEAHEAYLAKKHALAATRSKAIGQRGGVDGVRGDNGRLAEFKEDPGEYVERFRS